MVRIKKPKQIETFINGEPATLPKVLETVQTRHLRRKLGRYLNARELHKMAGITPTELAGWRRSGIVKSEKLDGIYYYSVKSILIALTKKPKISK